MESETCAIFTVSKRPAFSTVVHSGSQSLKGHAHTCRKCVWLPEDDANDAGNVNSAGNATSQSPHQIVFVPSSLSLHLLSLRFLSLKLVVPLSHCSCSPSHCSCSRSNVSVHHPVRVFMGLFVGQWTVVKIALPGIP